MSSRLYLSAATVSAIIGFVLVVGAFFLDNWAVYEVDRRAIIDGFNRDTQLAITLKDAFTKNINYFTRQQGMLWICFPDSVPSDSNSFMKFHQPCVFNMDYNPSDAVKEHYTQPQIIRLWFMRAAVASYAGGVLFVFLAFILGGFACFRRSSKNCMHTFVLLFLGAALITTSIGFFLYVNYMERSQLDMAPFFKSWEAILKTHTNFYFGWCLIACAVGVGFLIVAAALFVLASRAIKKDDEMAMCAKQGYMMPYYDKSATMMPYGYNTYGGSAYPYPFNPYNYGNAGGYYAYQTYGR